MTGKRTRYSAEKAKVALEALRGEMTTAQLAAKQGIHQTMVSEWKRQAIEVLASVFSGRRAVQRTAKAAEPEVEKLQPRSASPWWSGIPDQSRTSFLAKASGR